MGEYCKVFEGNEVSISNQRLWHKWRRENHQPYSCPFNTYRALRDLKKLTPEAEKLYAVVMSPKSEDDVFYEGTDRDFGFHVAALAGKNIIDPDFFDKYGDKPPKLSKVCGSPNLAKSNLFNCMNGKDYFDQLRDDNRV